MRTGPSSRPILLPFRRNFCFSSGVFEVLESDLFQDNLTTVFYSFGGVDDQCGVTSWAMRETGMLPLLSCNSGMTAWLKAQVEGFKCGFTLSKCPLESWMFGAQRAKNETSPVTPKLKVREVSQSGF